MRIIKRKQENTHNRIKLDSSQMPWLAPLRMLVITMIAFGYTSTMPRGLQEAEYLRMFGYDPSWYGIAILFMISGFLALHSLEKHGSPKAFLLSRFGRNFPTLAVFALCVVFIIFPIFGVPIDLITDPNASRLKQHSLYLVKVLSVLDANELTPGLLDDALYKCVIQGALWTFRWGAILYVGIAILWPLGLFQKKKLLLLFTVFTIIASSILTSYFSDATRVHPLIEFTATGLRLGWAMLIGMCTYAYRDDIPRKLIIPFVFFGFAAINYYVFPWTPFIEVSTELGFGFLCFLVMTTQRKTPKWIQKIPDISLALYVFNWPVTQLTLLVLPSLSALTLFVIAFPITVLVSLLVWALVSQKCNLRLKQALAFG
ncbi:MAG: hypothetical protein COA43_02305 [Robiginitomaculum sp.]|nr:MAG: hypothetical protein COA43_02305 [Robiginitomaculum sp.]